MRLPQAGAFWIVASLALYAVVHLSLMLRHPITGDDPVRAFMNREPNILLQSVYLQAGLPRDVRACEPCFFENSYINTQNQSRLPGLDNGLYHSNFHPVTYLVRNDERIPLFLAGRRGGLQYYFQKQLSLLLDSKWATVLPGLINGLLTVFFLLSVIHQKFGSRALVLGAALLPLSPILQLNHAPFLSEQYMVMAFWGMYYFLLRKERWSGAAVGAFCFLGLYFKISFLVFLPFLLIAEFPRMRAHFRALAAGGILYFALAMMLNESGRISGELLTRPEGYWKPFLFWRIAISDLFRAFFSQELALESVIRAGDFLYPLGFNHACPSCGPTRIAILGAWDYAAVAAFLSFLVLFAYSRDGKKELSGIFLSFVASVFATHMWATLGHALWPLHGLILLVTVKLLAGLDLGLLQRRAVRLRIAVGLAAAILLVNYLVRSAKFLSIYQANGPIAQFSYNLYDDISRRLVNKGILDPVLLLSTEVGILEFLSGERVKPFYVREWEADLTAAWKAFGSGHMLIPLRIEWAEGAMPRDLTETKVMELARAGRVGITGLDFFHYRGEKKYWLVRFRSLDRGDSKGEQWHPDPALFELRRREKNEIR